MKKMKVEIRIGSEIKTERERSVYVYILDKHIDCQEEANQATQTSIYTHTSQMHTQKYVACIYTFSLHSIW